jgi:hypothetical protein
MNLEKETNLFQKNGFLFTRKKTNHYTLDFSIENKHVLLSTIIDFPLIKLIYDLNPDVYETVHMEQENQQEAIVTLLMKPFFQDLGLPQRFSHLHIQKTCKERSIIFHCHSIQTHRPSHVSIPEKAKLMPINHMTIECTSLNPYTMQFHFTILFDSTLNIQPFAEKMVGLVVYKIFMRVKQFIENMTIE